MATSAPSEEVTLLDDPTRVAAILSPLRRRILEHLAEPDSAAGLARRLGLPRQKLNYHLRALEQAGFLELDETRQCRGCVERRLRATARAYLISPALLGKLTAEPEQVRDRFSSTYLLAVASRLIRDLTTLRRRAATARRNLPTITMQTDVRFRSPAARTAFAEELATAVARLAARYQDDDPGSRPFRFVIGGHPVITKRQDPEEAS
jgi:DNA-binding transcriptional ArsR family regulator